MIPPRVAAGARLCSGRAPLAYENAYARTLSALRAFRHGGVVHDRTCCEVPARNCVEGYPEIRLHERTFTAARLQVACATPPPRTALARGPKNLR